MRHFNIYSEMDNGHVIGHFKNSAFLSIQWNFLWINNFFSATANMEMSEKLYHIDICSTFVSGMEAIWVPYPLSQRDGHRTGHWGVQISSNLKPFCTKCTIAANIQTIQRFSFKGHPNLYLINKKCVRCN